MTEKNTEKKMDKYTALMNQKFLENKIKMIPSTIKETYSDLDQKNPVLVSRELIADDHVMLGVEYAPDGAAVRAYTTDANGKKISMTNIDEKNKYEDFALRDVISEHLQKISNLTENKKVKETKTVEPERKVRKTEVSKETANYINRRGQTKD